MRFQNDLHDINDQKELDNVSAKVLRIFIFTLLYVES